jgi:hypothetical protein
MSAWRISNWVAVSGILVECQWSWWAAGSRRSGPQVLPGCDPEIFDSRWCVSSAGQVLDDISVDHAETL